MLGRDSLLRFDVSILFFLPLALVLHMTDFTLWMVGEKIRPLAKVANVAGPFWNPPPHQTKFNTFGA